MLPPATLDAAAVAVGAVAGSLLRHRGPPGATCRPPTTLAVNAAASFVAGALAACPPTGPLAVHPRVKIALGAGFCGSLSTMSACERGEDRGRRPRRRRAHRPRPVVAPRPTPLRPPSAPPPPSRTHPPTDAVEGAALAAAGRGPALAAHVALHNASAGAAAFAGGVAVAALDLARLAGGG